MPTRRCPFLLPLAALAPALGQHPSQSFLALDDAPDADGARACAWSPDGTTLLVAHERTGDVTFLAPELVGRLPVGARPMDVEVSASLGLAVVPLAGDDAVALVDATARTLAATVPLSGAGPYQVELSPDGLLAFIACAASDTVVVVDLATGSEAWSFPTVDQVPSDNWPGAPNPFYGQPEHFPTFDLSPGGAVVAVPSHANGSVVAYDAATGAALGDMPGSWAAAVAVSASGRYVVSVTGLIGYVQVLDLATQTMTGYDPCEGGPGDKCLWGTTSQSLAVHPTADVAYFGSEGRLLALDLATVQPLGATTAGGGSLALSPDGTRAYTAAGQYGAALHVADLTTMSELAVLEDVRADQLVHDAALPRIAALDHLQGERVQWADLVGGTLVRSAAVPTGPRPEGDGPCWLATDRLGRLLVSANFRSNGVTIHDRESGETTSVATGDRPWVVEVDAAGTVALVGHFTGPAAVVDLTTRALVAKLPVPGHAVGVEPDGSRAYALDVPNRTLAIIDLAGGSPRVTGKVPLDNLVWPQADRTVATNGAGLVAVPEWSNHLVTFVDAAAGKVLERVELLGFPGQVVFGPEGRRAFVATGQNVHRLVIDGTNVKLAGKVKVVQHAVGRMALSEDGARLYTVAWASPSTLVVVDTVTMKKEHVVDLPPVPELLARGGAEVFVWSRYADEIQRVRVDDAGATIVGTLPVSSRPLDLLAAPDGVLHAIASLHDGVDAYDFVEDVRSCDPAASNSTGRRGTLHALDWPAVGVKFRLRAEGLPPGQPATFLVGDARGKVPFAGGGQGTRCVVGSVGRFEPDLVVGPDGAVEVEVDAEALPQPGAPVVIQPGETWHFQTWYRDSNPGPTSNLTDARSITFR